MSSNRRMRSPGQSSVLQLLSDLGQILPLPGPQSPHPVNPKGVLVFLQPPLHPTHLHTLLCAQKPGPCGLYHPDTLAGWPPDPELGAARNGSISSLLSPFFGSPFWQ